MTHFLFRQLMVVFAVGLLIPLPALAQTPDSNATSQEMSQDELDNIPAALEGYDVVTYYMPSGPQKGSKSYQALYNEKRYVFTSLENQQLFSQDPEKYLPEFEEYCGCAVSENRRVMADPTIFKVMEGKLVLFETQEALNLWEENETERYQKAQDFWKYENRYDANKRLQDDSRARLFTF